MRAFLIATILLLSSMGGPARSDTSLLALRVAPTLGYAPLDILVQVHVRQHPDNVGVVIVVDGPGYFANSMVEIGEGPVSLTLPYRGIPEGTYEVSAVLGHADGPSDIKEAERRTYRVTVLP